jgi:hypothetical protein
LTAQTCKPITNQNHTQSRYDPKGSSCDWEELPTKLIGKTHQLRETKSEKHHLTSLGEHRGIFHMQKTNHLEESLGIFKLSYYLYFLSNKPMNTYALFAVIRGILGNVNKLPEP